MPWRPLSGVPVLLTLLLCAVPAIAQNTAPQQNTATPPSAPAPSVGLLTEQIVALFPKLEGEVIEVQGTTLTSGIGRREGAIAGIELSLYREGRELRHPKTGELLGRAEQPVGRVMLQEVFEAYSTGKVTQGGDIQAGDKARVSAGKIKLTLLPFSDGVKDTVTEATTHELVEALNRTGRFQIGLGDAMNVWLAQQGVSRQDILEGRRLEGAAERFKLEQLVVVHYQRVQNKPYMDVRLYAFPGATSLLSTAMFVPPAAKPKEGTFSAGTKARDSQSPSAQKSLLVRLLTGELDAGNYSSGEAAIHLKEVAKIPYVVTAMDISVS